jgi:hypothetical protein
MCHLNGLSEKPERRIPGDAPLFEIKVQGSSFHSRWPSPGGKKRFAVNRRFLFPTVPEDRINPVKGLHQCQRHGIVLPDDPKGIATIIKGGSPGMAIFGFIQVKTCDVGKVHHVKAFSHNPQTEIQFVLIEEKGRTITSESI